MERELPSALWKPGALGLSVLSYPAMLYQDLLYAFRVLRAAPATALVAIASLAVGIGATTTIFSPVHAVLLASPDYKQPNRLVVVWESNPAKGITRTQVAPATFNIWRSQNRSFEQLELVAPGSPVTVTGGIPERVNIQYFTAGLFPLLGVHPVIGHAPSESDLSQNDPLLVSYGYWQRRFGGVSVFLGQKIIVNGAAHTVAGVLPRDFHLFDEKTDIWLPIRAPDPGSHDFSGRSWLVAVGRLRDGVDINTAQSEMNLLSQKIAQAHPDTNRDWGVRVESIRDAQFGYWKPVLRLLFGAVVFVLLICWANIANLLLGRLPFRNREIATRVSLGADSRRIFLQFLHEGALLGIVGGLLGLLLSAWGGRLFIALAPSDFPLLHTIAVNGPILLFCLAISLISGIAFSVAAAILASRTESYYVSASATRSSSPRIQRRFSTAFVAAEVAISLTLLSGAGLMVASMLRLLQIDPGFRTERVLTMQVFLTGRQYTQNVADGTLIKPAVASFYRELLARVAAAPGVQSAGLVSWLPEGGYNTGRRDRTFRVVGETLEKAGEQRASFNIVGSGYFQTLQIPLLAGRYLDPGDDENTNWVAVVNSAFARRYWPGQNPIGKQIVTDGGVDEKPREVVGVVSDVRQNGLELESEPEIFTPFLQQPTTNFTHGYQNRVHMSIVLRTVADQESTVEAVRRIAADLDLNQPVYGARSMSEVFSASLGYRTLYTRCLEFFAGIALFLAAIGVYSLISQSVAERTKEVGIRIAVGATQRSILELFFRQAAIPLVCGSLCGLLMAHFSNRLLRSMLFGITPDSALILATTCAVLFAIGTAAVLVPATRATRMDVVDALRYE